MSHPLRCRCGALQGEVVEARGANRALCYCRSCQAFAHFLGREGEILDPLGGSQVVQIRPARLAFTQGADNLACMRLTESGIMRWYAACCRTPIGNTLATPKVSFVGLLHSCLGGAGPALDAAFGPLRAVVYTATARSKDKPKPKGLAHSMLWFFRNGMAARLDGSWRKTPFFDAAGKPVVEPKVLPGDEHARLMAEVDAAIEASAATPD